MELALAEALWRLNVLRGEYLPLVAWGLLEAGEEGPAICALAALNQPTLRDAGPLFERILHEAGRGKMLLDGAARLVEEAVKGGSVENLREIAAATVDGTALPKPGRDDQAVTRALMVSTVSRFLAGDAGVIVTVRKLADLYHEISDRSMVDILLNFMAIDTEIVVFLESDLDGPLDDGVREHGRQVLERVGRLLHAAAAEECRRLTTALSKSAVTQSAE